MRPDPKLLASLKRRTVNVRLDRDCVEVSGIVLGASRHERTAIPDGSDPYEALETVLQKSRLLRAGRACRLDIDVESARMVYRTSEPPDGGLGAGGGPGIDVEFPDGLLDVLVPILGRRRVHGTVGVRPGPAARAIRMMRARIEQGATGRGLIIDRSSAAITVLVLDPADIPWARGGPADDPILAVELLVDRAAGMIAGRSRIDWWHLADVASPEDVLTRRRDASGFEAACHALVGHLPRIPVPL